jgi:hypothetical protein
MYPHIFVSGKQQTRTILITDKAIYNLTVKTYKCKRRINIGPVPLMLHARPAAVIVAPQNYRHSKPTFSLMLPPALSQITHFSSSVSATRSFYYLYRVGLWHDGQ